MFTVRIHGRDGQDVATLAELLAVAAFLEDRYAQAFPSFGAQRAGAPVAACCRIDDEPIRTREPVDAPDAVVVTDPSIRYQVDVLRGLHDHGYLLVNTAHDLDLSTDRPIRCCLVPATELARVHARRPTPDAALLGAFAAVTGCLSLDSVVTAIRRRLPGPATAGGVAAARAAYELFYRAHAEMSRA